MSTHLASPTRRGSPLVRLSLLGIAFGLALLSCGRDVTAPHGARFARGISWHAEFPPAYQQVAGTSGVVDFTHVRVVLHHADGSVALDTVITYPAGSDSLVVALDVQLLASAPPSGEPLSLNLAYVNAAGDTVFKGGPVGVTATPSSAGSAPPPAVTIPVAYTGPGSGAVGVQISPRSGSVTAGGTFTYTAVAVDAGGAPVPGTPIVWNSLDPSIASVPSAASGVVQAGNSRGNARIVAQLLTGPQDLVTLAVLPRATTLALQSGSGQTGLAGATLANPLVALVTASDGLGVGGVTVNFAVASGGGSVTTASAVTNASGFAQTSWKLGSTVGSQSVTASSGTLSGSPVTFTATAKSVTAAKLAIGSQPANASAGASIGTVTVVAQTADGDTASTFGGAVSVALAGGSSGATLGGTATVNAVAGVATFTGLTVSKSGTGYSLTASSTGLTGATTSTFEIAAASAGKLAFTGQPTSSVVGGSVGPLVVTATDNFGNVSSTFTGLVTLGIATNPGGATLAGTTSVNAVAGVATFGSVILNRPGIGYALSASATGLASATSGNFDIAVGPATTITVVSGAAQSGNVSAALGSPIVVQVQDAGGNGVPGKPVTFAVVSGGGSLSVTNAVTDASGNATTVWTLGATVGAQQISATSAGLIGSPLSIGATGTGVANHFVVTTQPVVGQTAGINVAPGLILAARDPSNNAIPGFTGAVTLTIANNPGGAALGGTTTVNAVAGVATFTAFTLDKVGAGYTLTASAAGFTSLTSSAFNIVAGAATTLAISAGNAQTGAVSSALATPLAVLVTDVGGNPIAGRAINWAVVTGGGSVGSPTSNTNASGIATVAWTLGATAGAQSVSATSAGLTGSPLTFTATASGTIASTTVAPKLTSADTITSIGATISMTATARDGGNNVVAGSYTWTSRTPAVATVTNSGVVTAVTNGGAWIIASEAGGTKDSALVTVNQILATINVTTPTLNIHLGQPATFTAQAVDGLGHPLTAQPTFTWSSTALGVATVNSSTGVAATVGLGSAQIRATANAITGVANVNVITAIQRIVVARDSAGFSTARSDTFNMASLALHRSYKAIAYDTLNNVMSGLTFTWASSNSSVALIDSSGTATARALSALNGNAFIQATAQGVTGSALLNVQQVLSSISVTPVSPSIQPTGSVSMTARGKDANNQFIAGGSFTWTSLLTSIATVNSSGVVTGVATGTDSITATSGAIHGTGAVIVANSVPAALSFGRDTVSVGRGSNTQVPILLSRPSATTTTLILSVADTFAYWSSTKVVVPANATSINAQLNGHNAGNSTITVTDSAGVYSPATSVLAVQATMHLTSGSYALNTTDQQSTQILLSDPSPVGGTFVTFNFGTANVGTISPSPAFIPAGQLAANIVITAAGAGTSTITPVAIGVNGTASSLTTYAANLSFSNTNTHLGAGQYATNIAYVSTPTNSVNGVPLTFASSDTNVVTVTPTGAIPAGSYYFYITTTAKAVGTATITVSSPSWTATNTLTVISTTPHVGISGGGNLQTTSPQQGMNVYSEDSLHYNYPRTSSLVVHLSSSDTTVMKVLDTLATIGPGAASVSGLRVIPNGAGGSAYIKVTAGGHTADSSLFNVVGPKLEFSWNANRVGAGQEDDNVYVYAPNNVVSPLVVNLTADTTKIGVPPTVTIPAGSYYAYFNVRGKVATTALPIIASAIGYQGDTSTYIVTSPRLHFSGGATLNNFSAPQGFTVYGYDSTLSNIHNRTSPVAITLTSTDTTIIKVDSSVITMAAGTYYANTAHVVPIGVGTAKIIATAPGHIADTATYTVQTPQLSVNFSTYTIGRLQDVAPSPNLYVSVPDNRTSQLLVTVTQKHAGVDSLSATVDTIPNGTYYRYFTLYGKTAGLDTLTFSAPGYLPVTAYVRVTTPRFATSGLSSNITTTNPPMSINVYAEDSLGTTHYTSDTVVVHAVSSDTTVLKPAQAYVAITKGNWYVNTTVNVVGPGTASITYSDSAGLGYVAATTNTVAVVGPSLSLNTGSVVLGMRQNTGPNGIYVSTPNNVATPLVVTLTSTSTRVATTNVSTVTIPANSYYAYFQINGQDTLGTIQIQATATGYNATSTTVQVTAPKFAFGGGTAANTTGTAQTITVYAEDANGNTHFTNENVSVTLSSSAPGVAAADSATVTILAGNYYTQAAHWIPAIAGTTQLSASDARAVFYKYTTANEVLTVNTPTLSLQNLNTLGIGQYQDSYFYVQTPDYQTTPLTVTLTHAGTVHSSIPASTIVGSGIYYSYFRIVGTSAGVDTITASASSPAHNPATASITIGNGRIDPLSGWPGSSLHLSTSDSVLITLYARDPSTNARYVLNATTFTLTPGANVQFVSGGAGSTVITSATIPANAQYVQFYMKALATGASVSSSISAANYTTYTNSVTVVP